MSTTDPRDVLDEHLYNDLQYLLCAATEWYVQHSTGPEGDHPNRSDKGDGYYIQVYAMDSAILHARALLEFLTGRTDVENHNHLGVDFLGVEPISSELYSHDWRDPMNRYLMHLNERPEGQFLWGFGDTEPKHLKYMPVDFAHEVVRLWWEFIKQLHDQDDPLEDLARTKLDLAIGQAAKVVDNGVNGAYGIDPIVWGNP
jgi:hypothetical protein